MSLSLCLWFCFDFALFFQISSLAITTTSPALTHPSVPGILLTKHLHSWSWSLPFGTLPFAPWPSPRKGKCEVLLVLEGHPGLSPREIGAESPTEAERRIWSPTGQGIHTRTFWDNTQVCFMAETHMLICPARNWTPDQIYLPGEWYFSQKLVSCYFSRDHY